MNPLVRTIVAVTAGVGGAIGLFTVALWGVPRVLPPRTARRASPWIFVGPTLLLLTLLVVIPALQTIVLSFRDADGEGFVGLDNLRWAVSSDDGLIVLRNNVAWVVVVTAVTTGLGLAVAVGSELSRRPRLVRSVVFMPMAISGVGASLIWQLVYAYKAEEVPQVGLLNQIVVWLGGQPQAFLVNPPWNNGFLMWIAIWAWTGFPTVILAAALRSVPNAVIEAARIDGASGLQTFRYVILPHIRTTIMLVVVATVATVLKVFDIIRVSTNGQFDTNVIANEMVGQAFGLRDSGRGAALAMLLFVLVAPVMVYNARQHRGSGA